MSQTPTTIKALGNELGHDLSRLTVQVQGAVTLYSGSGVPSAGAGVDGDLYMRTDTPGTTNQRIYVKSSGSWTGVV